MLLISDLLSLGSTVSMAASADLESVTINAKGIPLSLACFSAALMAASSACHGSAVVETQCRSISFKNHPGSSFFVLNTISTLLQGSAGGNGTSFGGAGALDVSFLYVNADFATQLFLCLAP